MLISRFLLYSTKNRKDDMNNINLSTHTTQWPSTKTTLGRLGKPVTLEATYALYQSVTVWKRFAYSKRMTRSVGSSTHCNKRLSCHTHNDIVTKQLAKEIIKILFKKWTHDTLKSEDFYNVSMQIFIVKWWHV